MTIDAPVWLSAKNRPVHAPLPPTALNAGWSWSIVVACETSGHHQHDSEYPFTVADGGEPRVVTRG